MKKIFYDFEVYCKDWLVVFIDYDTRKKTIIINDTSKLKKFYERFKKFYPYFETEYLVDLLIEHHNDDERKYKTFNNSLVFWALDEKHPFKILVI